MLCSSCLNCFVCSSSPSLCRREFGINCCMIPICGPKVTNKKKPCEELRSSYSIAIQWRNSSPFSLLEFRTAPFVRFREWSQSSSQVVSCERELSLLLLVLFMRLNRFKYVIRPHHFHFYVDFLVNFIYLVFFFCSFLF